MGNILNIAWLGLIFGMIGTTLGGALGIFINFKTNKILSFILEFAAGLMTAIICFDLIPEALNIVSIGLCIIGIVLGIMVTIKKQVPEFSEKEINEKIFGMIQEKEANITAFYTYGRAFNFKGNITNINKNIGISIPRR